MQCSIHGHPYMCEDTFICMRTSESRRSAPGAWWRLVAKYVNPTQDHIISMAAVMV